MRNWLYSDVNNDEVARCKPPYTNFYNASDPNSNSFCYDLEEVFGRTDASTSYQNVVDRTPMIFRCYIGIMPYYCPWLLKLTDYREVIEFAGYTQDVVEDELDDSLSSIDVVLKKATVYNATSMRYAWENGTELEQVYSLHQIYPVVYRVPIQDIDEIESNTIDGTAAI